jgi:hypothetical protein
MAIFAATNEERDMNYLLMIYANEAEFEAMSEAAWGRLPGICRIHQVDRAGRAIQSGDRLRPVSTASTVRVRNGKTAITDGPFAETREQLGGYYLVDAKDLDEAIAIAARIPSARTRQHRGASDLAHDLIDGVFRREAARVLATLIRLLGDFDLAEDARQEAFAAAIAQWPTGYAGASAGVADRHRPQQDHRSHSPRRVVQSKIADLEAASAQAHGIAELELDDAYSATIVCA